MEFDLKMEEMLLANYWYLFNAYRRGNFEMTVDPSKFKFYPDSNDEEMKGNRYATIKPAADNLLSLVCSLMESTGCGPESLCDAKRTILVAYELRIQVLRKPQY